MKTNATVGQIAQITSMLANGSINRVMVQALLEGRARIVRSKESYGSGSRFEARVDYVQPGFEELERRFRGEVADYYRSMKFEPIDCCKAVSHRRRVIAFELVEDMEDYYLGNEVRAELKRRGLRPALYEEGIDWAEQCLPDGPRLVGILGSEGCENFRGVVAVLQSNGNGWWGLYFSQDQHFGGSNWQFLAVRETA